MNDSSKIISYLIKRKRCEINIKELIVNRMGQRNKKQEAAFPQCGKDNLNLGKLFGEMNNAPIQ